MFVVEITKWMWEQIPQSSRVTGGLVLLLFTLSALVAIAKFDNIQASTQLHTSQIADLSTSARTNNDRAEERYLEILKVIGDVKADGAAIQTALKDLEWYVRAQVQPHRVP